MFFNCRLNIWIFLWMRFALSFAKLRHWPAEVAINFQTDSPQVIYPITSALYHIIQSCLMEKSFWCFYLIQYILIAYNTSALYHSYTIHYNIYIYNTVTVPLYHIVIIYKDYTRSKYHSPHIVQHHHLGVSIIGVSPKNR